MDGAPRQVIDYYQQLTFADQETSLVEQSDPPKLAECTSVSFLSPDCDCEKGVRTGYPMVARVGYRVSNRATEVIIRVSIFWPSGYLCAQLSTGELELVPGTGVVEFKCPILPIVPGLYRIDLSIETDGQEIDARPRCATLRVDPGKPVFGDFHIENEWSVVKESVL